MYVTQLNLSTNGHVSITATTIQWPLFCRQSIHWILFKPLHNCHSLQRPLSSVPKVAIVERLNFINCNKKQRQQFFLLTNNKVLQYSVCPANSYQANLGGQNIRQKASFHFENVDSEKNLRSSKGHFIFIRTLPPKHPPTLPPPPLPHIWVSSADNWEKSILKEAKKLKQGSGVGGWKGFFKRLWERNLGWDSE